MAAPRRCLLLLAALALAAAPALAQPSKKVNVKTTVVEQLPMRHVFPVWKKMIDKNLLNLIPNEDASVPKEAWLKNRFALLYRGTMTYASVAGICPALAAKNTVTLSATKKKLSETVAVRGATAACVGNKAGKGKAPTQSFVVLVQKSNVPAKNMWTVMYCEAKKTDCHIYRLFKPCLKGRCKVEPDPSLASSVFSSTADVISSSANCDETIGRYTDAQAQCKTDKACLDIMSRWEGYAGVQFDTPERVKESLANFRATIARVVDSCKKGAKHEVGTTEFSDMSKKEFAKDVLSNLTVAPGDALNVSEITKPKPKPGDVAAPGKGSDNVTECNGKKVTNITECIPEEKRPSDANVTNTTTGTGGSELPPSDGPPPEATRRRLLGASSMFAVSDDLPAKVDWVAAGKVSPVRDQGACNCAWAIAALTVIESKIAIDSGKAPVPLSVQQILECSPPQTGVYAGPCSSGNQNTATDYTLYSGIHTEANYPYTSGFDSTTGFCKAEDLGKKPRARVIERNSVTSLPEIASAADRQQVLMSAVSKAPVLVFLSGSVLQDYRGGVVEPKLCTPKDKKDLNLAAALVGYDTDKKVWILQNSMGKTFGEAGTFELSMTNADAEPLGPCGIYGAVVALPTVEVKEEDALKVEVKPAK